MCGGQVRVTPRGLTARKLADSCRFHSSMPGYRSTPGRAGQRNPLPCPAVPAMCGQMIKTG